MRFYNRLAAGLIVFAASVALPVPDRDQGYAGGRAECGEVLTRIVAGLDDGEIVPVWIFFSEPPENEEAFSPRVIERISRRGAPFRDLPPMLHPERDSIDRIRPFVERIRHRSWYFNAVSADVRVSMVGRLLEIPGVAKVDAVRRYRRIGEPVTFGPEHLPRAVPSSPLTGKYGDSFNQLYMIEAVDLLEMGYNGSGGSSSGGQIMIGILDTGFLLDHYAFDRLEVHAQWDFINDDPVTENEPGDHPDQDRHGTLVLGTIAGYGDGGLIGPAWGASYLLAKTELVGYEIPIEEDNWVAGLEWCDSIGADIVTSSLGYIDWYDPVNDLDGETALCTRAANRAASRGVIVCNAVGNYGSGTTSLIAPADADSVITVGGVYADGSLWSSSSRGPTSDGRIKPDVMAQAVSVQSVAWPEDYGYGKYSGTSFATPLVAGVCAQLLEIHPGWSPMELRDSLRVHATNSDSPDNNYGWGIIKGLATSGIAPEDGATGITFSHPYPNPFRDSVAFDLYSGRWTYVSARVFDSAGHMVRKLIDEEPLLFGATFEWDGMNDGGKEAASGVYYVEFISPQARQAMKIVRIR
jgi:subtilisin family serine protease